MADEKKKKVEIVEEEKIKKNENKKQTTDVKNEKKEKSKSSKTDKKIKALEKQNKEALENLQRLAAEFDNFRKRTIKEKEAIYVNATKDIIESFLPVIDNMELANQNVHKSQNIDDVIKGFELVYRQFNDVLEKIGVEPIECIDQDFDPELHNAVMHVEDDKYQENKVIEELQKGYTYKGKVIRHSMVKVAN